MNFNNVNWNLYKTFTVVYETQNLQRTAEILLITRSAVGQNIKELERQLGVILFTPTTRGVIPTTEATNVYSMLKNSVATIVDTENSLKSFTSESKGIVRIGMADEIVDRFITEYIKQFHIKYPLISLEFFRHKGLSQLNVGNLDFLFDFKHKITNPDLKVVDIFHLTGNLVASKSFLKKHGLTQKISAKDFLRLPILTYRCEPVGDNFWKQLCPNAEPVILDTDSYLLAKFFLDNDLGVGWYAKEVLELLGDNNLVEVVTIPHITLPNSMISCAHKRNLSRAARVFLDGLFEYYKRK